MIIINIDDMIIDNNNVNYSDMRKIHDYNISLLGKLIKRHNIDIIISTSNDLIKLDEFNIIKYDGDGDNYKYTSIIDSINDYINSYIVYITNIKDQSDLSNYEAPITLNMFKSHYNFDFDLIHTKYDAIERAIQFRVEFLKGIKPPTNDVSQQATYADKLYKVLDTIMSDVTEESINSLFNKGDLTDNLLNQFSRLSKLLNQVGLIDDITSMVIVNAFNTHNYKYIDPILLQIEPAINNMYDTIIKLGN